MVEVLQEMLVELIQLLFVQLQLVEEHKLEVLLEQEDQVQEVATTVNVELQVMKEVFHQ